MLQVLNFIWNATFSPNLRLFHVQKLERNKMPIKSNKWANHKLTIQRYASQTTTTIYLLYSIILQNIWNHFEFKYSVSLACVNVLPFNLNFMKHFRCVWFFGRLFCLCTIKNHSANRISCFYYTAKGMALVACAEKKWNGIGLPYRGKTRCRIYNMSNATTHIEQKKNQK